MRAIIVDDEQPSIDMLRLLLAEEGTIDIVGCYRKPKEALAEAAFLQPDVAFLDVDMPAMNGLELAGRLAELCENLEIVFTTAYEQYALQAFQHSAIDYLLKPLTQEAVNGTIRRLYKRKGTLPQQQRPNEAYAKCFGEFCVFGREGRRIKWRTTKTEELLAYFLVKRGTVVSKWEILADLWPDSSDEQAHTYLHTTVYNLKKGLKEAGIEANISYAMGKYKAEITGMYSELADFVQFAALQSTVTADNEHTFIRIEALYNSELFGDRDYAWSATYKEMLYQSYCRTARQLGFYLLAAGRPAAASDTLRRLLSFAPYDEAAHEAMLGVYAAKRDRVSLVRHYRKICEMFERELDLPMNPSLIRTYDNLMGKLAGEEIGS